MKENKYDDAPFFEKYSQMDRSKKGLDAAGEWHALRAMLPPLAGKRVLDMGCGFGWHCQYAMEQGAVSATGIDISENMLEQARAKNRFEAVHYHCMPMEDANFARDSFDMVISSLALHYVASFADICRKVHQCLSKGGDFVFSVEHPVFTAQGTQDWYYDAQGNILHWPVDKYFTEGPRHATFLGESITKYHKTLTTYMNTCINTGFELKEIVEPQPAPHLLHSIPAMEDELRRPMMLLVAAIKK